MECLGSGLYVEYPKDGKTKYHRCSVCNKRMKITPRRSDDGDFNWLIMPKHKDKRKSKKYKRPSKRA